eukprot:3472020-Prymnesium_polylepis.2
MLYTYTLCEPTRRRLCGCALCLTGPVAAKTLHDASEAQLEATERELLVHASLTHPGVSPPLSRTLKPHAPEADP